MFTQNQIVPSGKSSKGEKYCIIPAVENDPGQLVVSAKTLLYRLERLSADSIWAHKASGLRGSLIHALKQLEENPSHEATRAVEKLIRQGDSLLIQAAREIPEEKR